MFKIKLRRYKYKQNVIKELIYTEQKYNESLKLSK